MSSLAKITNSWSGKGCLARACLTLRTRSVCVIPPRLIRRLVPPRAFSHPCPEASHAKMRRDAVLLVEVCALPNRIQCGAVWQLARSGDGSFARGASLPNREGQTRGRSHCHTSHNAHIPSWTSLVESAQPPPCAPIRRECAMPGRSGKVYVSTFENGRARLSDSVIASQLS